MNYVRVVINGESWGIYLNAQQFNKDFTRDFFNSTKGVRWKVPGSPGGRAGLNYLGERIEALQAALRDQDQGRPAEPGRI